MLHSVVENQMTTDGYKKPSKTIKLTTNSMTVMRMKK